MARQDKMEWTLETYRLDEIERKFDLPCVICLNEGYYSDTDTEGFSQGDIMSIDSKLVLHKVAANFAYYDWTSEADDPNYVELTTKEILVPLNYKGKLKVLRDVKNFNSVRELSNDFPRFAKVRENFKVMADRNIPVTIQAGMVIELDRIIPRHKTASGEEPDKLVIQFPYRTGVLAVAAPLDARGKFRTEPDENEYTIQEAINRYRLPQLVRFVDDEIKRVYTQDLLEGIENMKTITAETIRLNRLVSKNVLVGHYKPLDEAETKDSEMLRQRTLAVLPIDDPGIRSIEVNVLKGITDDIYEEVFLVRNTSNSSAAKVVEGSLYVDFVNKSGIQLIQPKENKDPRSQDKPPPRPPKPGQYKPQKQGSKTEQKRHPKPLPKPKDLTELPEYEYPETSPTGRYRTTHEDAVPKRPPKPSQKPQPDLTELSDYEFPEASPTRLPSDYTGFSLADLNFNAPKAGHQPAENVIARGKELLSNLKQKFKVKEKNIPVREEQPKANEKPVPAPVKPRPRLPDPIEAEDDDLGANLPVYDEVDELKMDNSSQRSMKPPKPIPVGSKPVQGNVTSDDLYLSPVETRKKPTARVAPSSNRMEGKNKQFKDLNTGELVERLKLCGLNNVAGICAKERLNGSFFTDVTKESLEKEMELTGISLFKFLQMRDNNWMPT